MKTSDYKGVRASSLSVSATHLDVTLEDGRMLRIPVSLFPKLRNAPSARLSHWEWVVEGIGLEWPELDEHSFDRWIFKRNSLLCSFQGKAFSPPTQNPGLLKRTGWQLKNV